MYVSIYVDVYVLSFSPVCGSLRAQRAGSAPRGANSAGPSRALGGLEGMFRSPFEGQPRNRICLYFKCS